MIQLIPKGEKNKITQSPDISDIHIDLWRNREMMDGIIIEQAAQFYKQKDSILKSALQKKGYGYLIEGIEKKRFPKIMSEIKDGWESFYVDNDTDEGVFIVSIQEPQFNYIGMVEDSDTRTSFRAEIICAFRE